MLGFGLFGRIWVRIGPKGDEALRMGRGGRTYGRTDVRTDGRTDSPCVLQDFVPFGAAAQKPARCKAKFLALKLKIQININFKAQIPSSMPNSILEAQILSYRFKYQSQSPNISFQAQIPTFQPKFQPHSPNSSLEIQIRPKSPNLKFQLMDGEGENFPYIVFGSKCEMGNLYNS